MRELIELFFIFVKIGCICFGGGYTILPILEKEFIQKRKWITVEEVIKFYTIAQITPGVIVVNVSTFIGYNRKKVLGGIISTVAVVLPSITMVVIISFLIKNFASYQIVQHCFAGIRLAVGVLVFDTVIKLIKNICKKENGIIYNVIYMAFFIAALLASVIFKINPVMIIVSAAVVGLLLTLATLRARLNAEDSNGAAKAPVSGIKQAPEPLPAAPPPAELPAAPPAQGGKGSGNGGGDD